MSKSTTNIRGQSKDSTPISLTQAHATHDPEFLDAKGLRERFGITRSLAYALVADGAIRSVSLRRRGQVRGKRLFVVDSVREFLRLQMEGEAKHVASDCRL